MMGVLSSLGETFDQVEAKVIQGPDESRLVRREQQGTLYLCSRCKVQRRTRVGHHRLSRCVTVWTQLQSNRAFMDLFSIDTTAERCSYTHVIASSLFFRCPERQVSGVLPYPFCTRSKFEQRSFGASLRSLLN